VWETLVPFAAVGKELRLHLHACISFSFSWSGRTYFDIKVCVTGSHNHGLSVNIFLLICVVLNMPMAGLKHISAWPRQGSHYEIEIGGARAKTLLVVSYQWLVLSYAQGTTQTVAERDDIRNEGLYSLNL
jgi:hypothetical protein